MRRLYGSGYESGPRAVAIARSWESDELGRVGPRPIDAAPAAIRGLLIGAALVLPFWDTVATVALRLLSGH